MRLAIVLVFLGCLSARAQCTPVQVFKFLADDGAAGDHFGGNRDGIAISGKTAIVGVYRDDDNGENSGSAYLFDTTTGQQIAKLLPEDGESGDRFGGSVSISGTTAIIGARLDDDNGEDSGSAYLFDTMTGQQLAKLLPDDGAADHYFGTSVEIEGNLAIVGATRASGTGAAYLFDSTTGQQIRKLLSEDGQVGDHFGSSVAISGTIAIVGAPSDDEFATRSGSAYLFNTTTGQQLARLRADFPTRNDYFGRYVKISGAIAIVGCDLDDDNGQNSGSAYLFDSTTGSQIAKLLPDDGAADDNFGTSVAIDGTTAIVGAFYDDDNGEHTGST